MGVGLDDVTQVGRDDGARIDLTVTFNGATVLGKAQVLVALGATAATYLLGQRQPLARACACGLSSCPASAHPTQPPVRPAASPRVDGETR